jgi:hypothetical protein
MGFGLLVGSPKERTEVDSSILELSLKSCAPDSTDKILVFYLSVWAANCQFCRIRGVTLGASKPDPSWTRSDKPTNFPIRYFGLRLLNRFVGPYDVNLVQEPAVQVGDDVVSHSILMRDGR